jgi:hypothetical protein
MTPFGEPGMRATLLFVLVLAVERDRAYTHSVPIGYVSIGLSRQMT